MGETRNISGSEAVEKLKSLAEGKTCFYVTYSGEYNSSARPMTIMGVDDDGTLLFFCPQTSDTARQTAANANVQILMADTGSYDYLVVTGKGIVGRDRGAIEKFWSPLAGAYFENGKDDPELSTVRVTPKEAHYWESKDGKIISLAKILFAAATGTAPDEGRQGDIKV